MASRSVKLPDIGEGIAEAEIVEWSVKVGDVVREDQVIASVMTDKATIEIPSPFSGRVVALGGEVGEKLAIGGELIRLEVEGEPGADTEPTAEAHEAQAAPPRRIAEEIAQEFDVFLEETKPSPVVKDEPTDELASKPLASPAVRRRAKEADVDLKKLSGSGPDGRIEHRDLDRFLGENGERLTQRAPNIAIREKKVFGLRRLIAQKMQDAKRRAAHFSYVEEVDVTALEELRAQLNAHFTDARPKLTPIAFLVEAIVRTVGDFPHINAHFDDERGIMRTYGAAHVGIATQTESGLMVPVLRHAETRDLWGNAAEIKRLSDDARDGSAKSDELSGSTITITSLGALGGIVATPILNMPEVAIIGVNKQVMRPMWRDNQFVPRLMMNLSASFDHRVIDGYDGARFVQALKALLESPALLLIDA